MGKRFLIIAMAIATLGLGGCLGVEPTRPEPPKAETGVTIGKAAAKFQLADLAGKNTEALQPGKVTVINFWATWCPPCQAEMPELQKFVQTHGANVNFWAVNIQEPKENVQSFLQRKNFSLPVLLDSEGKVAEKYGVSAIPTTLVIDKDGIIRYRKSGTVTMAELEGVIKGL